MSNKMVLVEYLDDHEACSGLPDEDDKAFTIEEGTQRYVDARSAKSLVKKGKVKIVVDEKTSAASDDDAAEAADSDVDDESDDTAADTAAPASSSTSTWPPSGAN